jgi:hypothetical protein
VTTQIDDSKIVKSIEPGLLAVLVHFDMCLLKSSINQKEKCQVLESLNVLISMLGIYDLNIIIVGEVAQWVRL